MNSLQNIARALGGEVYCGDQVLAPAPGHGPKDRGMCVRLDPSAPDGVLVHLFNGGDALAAKDYVRERCGFEPFKPNGRAAKITQARTVEYDYCDPATGDVRYRKKRFEREDATKFFSFYQPGGTKGLGGAPHLLYGAERLADLSEGHPVWIVEGEKKVDRMRELGATAVSGDTGAQSRWLPAHAELLRGLPVILWPDSDNQGEKYAANAAAAILAVDPSADIRVVRPFGLPDGAKGRDVCDWTGDLAGLAASSLPYEPMAADKREPAGKDPDPGYEPPRKSPHAPPAPFANIINPVDWEGVPIPERESIVQGYIPHKTVTLLSGDGGQGKSLLALQLAAARALARDWIGVMPEPGRTLVLSAEDDGDEMHRRLDKIREFYKADWADLADIRIVDLVGENSVLGALLKGQIEPTEMYRTLDADMASFKPSLTVLDVLADMFGGQENDRAHVRQFIRLLKQLARKHECAILLLAHPSLTGMSTGTGLSGSTDWNNGVRSRLYFQTPKTCDDETPNKNLRMLEGMKSNYGELGGKIDLEWKNGLFVPIHVPGGFNKLAAEQKADDMFIRLLKRFNSDGRNASEKSGTSYAPAIFEQQPDADGVTRKQFKAAMDRLFHDKKIRVSVTGPKSRPERTLILADE